VGSVSAASVLWLQGTRSKQYSVAGGLCGHVPVAVRIPNGGPEAADCAGGLCGISTSDRQYLTRAFDEFGDRPGVRTSVGTIRFVGVWNARVQFKDAVSRQLIKVVVFALHDNGGVGGGGAQHPDPLVPAALFCAVQRTVGQVEHLFPAEQRGGVLHEREKAEPDGTAQANSFAVVQVETMALNRVTQAVRQTGGGVPIGLPSHEQEFIAAPANQGVRLTAHTHENFFRLDDDPVAGLMSVGIIDRLEAIQIHHQEQQVGVCLRT